MKEIPAIPNGITVNKYTLIDTVDYYSFLLLHCPLVESQEVQPEQA